MARVTVEDCVDKVPNRFELVLLAAHRARSIANGSQVTVEPDNDKNPVIALREIADKTIPPDDLREGLIHSIQKNVEVDEPEAAAAPSLPQDRRPMLGRDDQSSDTVVDVITEEQLLRGMESLTPTEPSANGGSGRGDRLVAADAARCRSASDAPRAQAVLISQGVRDVRAKRTARRAMMRQYELVERVLEVRPERQRGAAQSRLRLRHEGARPPEARFRRSLLLPPPRGGGHPHRAQARRRHHRRRAAARRDRGHRRHARRDRPEVRQGDRRPGRRPDQDQEARPRHQEGRAGRELPQAAGRHLERHPRAADQARRPPAQHAHARST